MTPKVPDYGHHGADKELIALIRRLRLSYLQARISLSQKIEDYLAQFEKDDAMMRALYDSGELSHEDYMKWKYSTLAETKQWKNMLNQLANDLTHQNQIAASMINDTLPGVYALNHNYGTFEAEKGSGFDTTYTMYDKYTVKKLLTEHEDLLPHPSVPIEKDLLWNKQHLQSALLQGILTGEPVKDIAKRFEYCTNMTENAAIRNARTAVTGAENAGRIDSYKRAEKMGIKMQQMWMATLDGRTRDSHAMMDGEHQEVGKKFSNGCRYPGDPQGAPGEVYNCRCTVVAVVEGADPYNPNLRKSSYLEDEGLTYEEWKQMHGERYYTKLFKKQDEDQPFDRSKVQYSWEGAKLHMRFDMAGVEWKEVAKMKNRLTEEEIINKLAGGDKTCGSCMSLAYAYVGNKFGLDVLDFRGGNSCNVMARGEYLLSKLGKAVDNTVIEIGSTIRPAKALLKQVEKGKEYIFVTGRHASIVRKNDEGELQYLELQSSTKNGWQNFEYEFKTKWGIYKYTISDILKDRFGCGALSAGISYLTDISCFENDDELRDLLGYINTAVDKQEKGVSGGIK